MLAIFSTSVYGDTAATTYFYRFPAPAMLKRPGPKVPNYLERTASCIKIHDSKQSTLHRSDAQRSMYCVRVCSIL